MKTLNELRNLGVTTLSVTKDLATAVNPYQKVYHSKQWFDFFALDLPPLPTSGIPDGLVGIEEVEEEEQYKLDGKWFKVNPNTEDWFRNGGNEFRFAIRYKQQEEVKPEGETLRNVSQEKFKRLLENEAHKSLCVINIGTQTHPDYLVAGVEHMVKDMTAIMYVSLPQPEQPEQFKCTHEALTDTGVGYHYCPACKESWKVEQPEQTAEGILDKIGCLSTSHYVTFGISTDNSTTRNIALEAMQEYASLRLSQYKASLIEKLEGVIKSKNGFDLYKGGIREAIDLIKNS